MGPQQSLTHVSRLLCFTGLTVYSLWLSMSTNTDLQQAMDASLGIRGRVAVVTGGSRGIGRAAVDCFARLGAHVVVNYVSDQRAALATAGSAQASGVKAITVQADISRIDDADRLVKETLAEFGRIDFLVCNAGIWEAAPSRK